MHPEVLVLDVKHAAPADIESRSFALELEDDHAAVVACRKEVLLRVGGQNPEPDKLRARAKGATSTTGKWWSAQVLLGNQRKMRPHRSFSRRNVWTPMRLEMSQTRMDRSSEFEMISSYLGWKMTQETLFVWPRRVSTSHALVSVHS